MATKTTPKTDALKNHRTSKAEKQAGLKLSGKAKDALITEDEPATDAPEAKASPKQKKQPAPAAELSPTEQAGMAFYRDVTVKKFKSARKEVAVPAFVGGAQHEHKIARKVIEDLYNAVEGGKDYAKPLYAAKDYLNRKV